MAELATIARPYAEALFRVAQSSGKLAGWADLVAEMAHVAEHPGIKAIAQSPAVSPQQLTDVFLAAVKAPAGDDARNFVFALAENGRLSLLPEIAAQFHVLKNAHDGAADVEIASAFALTDAQLGELVAALEKKFGRKLLPSVTVDSDLIGGVRVVVGDEVLDTSVRAKLQQLHAALAA
jgi:F-type H+-transporting ATPase subunit delta